MTTENNHGLVTWRIGGLWSARMVNTLHSARVPIASGFQYAYAASSFNCTVHSDLDKVA